MSKIEDIEYALMDKGQRLLKHLQEGGMIKTRRSMHGDWQYKLRDGSLYALQRGYTQWMEDPILNEAQVARWLNTQQEALEIEDDTD